jgi:hypothetical protein
MWHQFTQQTSEYGKSNFCFACISFVNSASFSPFYGFLPLFETKRLNESTAATTAVGKLVKFHANYILAKTVRITPFQHF